MLSFPTFQRCLEQQQVDLVLMELAERKGEAGNKQGSIQTP